jgi:hypothetical protein
MQRVQGVIQCVDTLGRQITVQLVSGLEVFYVPPDCPITLRGEHVKLRMIQARDQARLTYDNGELLVVKQLEVQPGWPSGSYPTLGKV